MKSNTEALRKRGMIEQTDLDKLHNASYTMLLDKVNSPVAWERSAAVRILAERKLYDEDFLAVILNRLYKEKCLYTKLEICSVLEKGNIDSARSMVNHLGKIGTNQYKKLPNEVSKKVSYPLPRDIIARTLGKMSADIFPALTEVLCKGDSVQIAEVLDAIGFMVFYNKQLATDVNLEFISKYIELFRSNEIIFWKYTQCLSAFPLKAAIQKLEEIKAANNYSVIISESVRSLNSIRKKMIER